MITPSGFNTSTKYYFQACIRDPYVLLKGTICINESVQELCCQDCKLYTCLNWSLSSSNHSFVILRRRLGIWLPVNQIRPWEGSLEAQALLKVIKKYCNIPQGLLDSVAIMRIIAIATAMAVAGVALHQTIHRTTSAQQWHQNAGPAWGSQTHIDQEINEQLVDLENAVLLRGDRVQNFKITKSSEV